MQTDVRGYLESKNLHLKEAGGVEVHTSCFYCDEDPQKRGRLYINIDPNADILGLHTCFKCGESGAFPKIMRHFGDRMETEEEDNSEVRLEILRVAAAYYHDQLADFPDALGYLKGPKRRLTLETIVNARLGYASEDFVQDLADNSERWVPSRNLYLYLRELGYATPDIMSTGLVIEDRYKKLIDSLSGMITIPYMVAGNVVAIRGRAWPYVDGDKKPKYKTCGGTSARLYNTDAMWETDEICVTEGEFDALIVEQMGYRAVGLPGANVWQDTWDAYTTDKKRIWVILDRDDAGEKGAAKLVEKFGSKVRRIHLSPKGVKCDPTQWVAKGHTAEDFAALLLEAQQGGLLVTVDQAIEEHEWVQGQTGIQFGNAMLDQAIQPGLLPSQVCVVLSKTGGGKEEPVSAELPTPAGYRKIGDLVPGDMVFGRDGRPTQVTGVFPQGVKRLCRVRFSDGTDRVVGWDHLWEVWARGGRRREWMRTVLSSRQILERGFRTGNRNKEWKWRIPMCDPVQYEPADLPVSPYVMGFYLANGSGLGSSAVITVSEQNVWDEILAEDGRIGAISNRPGCERATVLGIIGKFRGLGVHVKSAQKFIPDMYLRGSIDQRVQLLHGMLDGDGSSSAPGRRCISYSSTSPRLIEGLTELVNSLGGTCVTSWRDRTREGKSVEATSTIMLPDEISPFSTDSRKYRGTTKNKHVPHRAIVSIEEAHEEEAVCISVEAKDSLYLTGSEYIVTHNTIFLLNMMQRMSMVPGQENLKFLFISLEQTRGEWWERARRIHRFYNLDATDRDAADFWRERLMIVDQNRVTAKQVHEVVADYEYRMGSLPDVIVLDYLGYWAQSFKGDRYERTSDAVMTLKALAKDLRRPIIAPHQVSRVAKDGEEFSSDAARDAGVVEETADFMFQVWSPDNSMARSEEERSGIINMRVGKSRHGSRGLLLKYQWAPLSLVMVPQNDPSTTKLCALARDELLYSSQGFRNDWLEAQWRHRTGFKLPSQRPDATFTQLRT